MRYSAFTRFAILALAFLGFSLASTDTAKSQTTTKNQPKLEPIAETKLIMEGMTSANFRGLERLLQEKPGDAKAWTFARGQALLIAESANLLMMRPPKNKGQTTWFDRAVELRNNASQLAKMVAIQDYNGSRSSLTKMAGTCNRCHQAFRVGVEVNVFADKKSADR